ncbi:phosphotransferase [Gordonia zhaorongruii]|uniref:phosphotransferase n=1 Tax=Gordonia zhaorongruii TaxID=2597659 RepID=UPI00104B2192|nr:phosphotransferase [Gordonia zhaorongruii]
MTVVAHDRIDSVLCTAQETLSRRAGSPVRIDEPEDLGGSGRSTVLRVRVVENPLSPDRSLVVKAFDENSDPDQVLREIASYRYATALPTASRPGPQLLASDLDSQILVLTDLGHGRPMTELLGSADVDEVRRCVSAWGQALGRMHAATYGGEDDFRTLLRVSGPKGGRRPDVGANSGIAGDAAGSVRRADEVAAELGVELSQDFREVLERGLELFGEGRFRAFSPSDVGPENILLNDDGVQFMDYEWGSFRDATLDVAYALVTFPATLSQQGAEQRVELERALVDAWRAEVLPLWPGLADDLTLDGRLAEARTLWVWLGLYWMLESETSGHDWALHTSDPRLVTMRWSELAETAPGTATGDVLGGAARDIRRALQRLWFE